MMSGTLCVASLSYPVDQSLAQTPPSIVESAVLQASNGTAGDRFGFAVAIEGDVAIVGAAGDSEQDLQSGAAYVFERNPSGVWIQIVKLLPQDPGTCKQFGSSVALDGNTLLIGQRGSECDPETGSDPFGSVYVFERSEAGWMPAARLGPPGFQFAFFTALDGRIALASEPNGAVAYRKRDDGRWSSPVPLRASASVGDDEYSGARVDVADGTAVLGSTGDLGEPPFVDTYELTERGWHRTQTINLGRPGTDFWGRPHVAIERNILLADRFVYERSATGLWSRTARLRPATVPVPDEFPGESALSRRGIAVLMRSEGAQGTAYVYERKRVGSWKLIVSLRPGERGANFFGRVDTDGRTVIAGGITANGERVAYIFDVSAHVTQR